ncbi:MAG TPA: hypothetical protein VGS59_13305 [Candidatus Acidoferrales bacterium]|nr:hypothetical protein [Candidatus Acidoferrales bacterium]
MKTPLSALALFCLATVVAAAPPEHYLHVKVDGRNTKELVRINMPLSLIEKIIPAINQNQFHNGRIEVGDFHTNDVDVKAILNAVSSAPDGEFVTIQKPDCNIRVAKQNGQMIVHIINKEDGEKADVSVPLAVAQALASAANDHQFNLEAAIEALDRAGERTLVTVTDNDETVRVWIDSQNTSD